MTMGIMQEGGIGRFRVGELGAVPVGSNRTRRRAFMLCRNGWATPGIDASSTLIWIIPHRILSTGELGIGLCTTALTDVPTVTGQSRRDDLCVVSYIETREGESLTLNLDFTH